jgi:hypothetical protein
VNPSPPIHTVATDRDAPTDRARSGWSASASSDASARSVIDEAMTLQPIVTVVEAIPSAT